MQLRSVSPAQDLRGTEACQHKALVTMHYHHTNGFLPGPDEKSPDSAEREDTLEPVIRTGSLKVGLEDRAGAAEGGRNEQEIKKENAPKGQQQKEEATDNKKSKTLPTGKKSRAGSSARTNIESNNTTAPPWEENKELHTSAEPFKVRAHSVNH
ncbi:hypothetical protein F7725_004424 [Dissostichus mawsoni]|uniref:Uncharacterized protein n=1 Tax=Dissostichus mawsoni TaxID=36200 RepID=A0A7J5XJ04_DISMA|nr:hypothetical protein F7725_004424 [Dissostichus mawsoni]